MMKFEQDILPAIKGKQAIMHVETTDLEAFARTIVDIASNADYKHFDRQPKKVFRWGPATGLECLYMGSSGDKDKNNHWMDQPQKREFFNGNDANKNCSAVQLAERLLHEPAQNDESASIPQTSIVLAEFLDPFLNNQVLLQLLVDGVTGACGPKYSFSKNNINIIFVGPTVNLDKQLLKYSMPLTFDLPDEDKLKGVVCTISRQGADALPKKRSILPKEHQSEFEDPWYTHIDDLHPLLVPHLKGLTTLAATTAIKQAIAAYSGPDIEPVIKFISAYKMQVVENSKVLRFLPYNEQEDESSIGGFDEFLDFVKLRKHIFSAEGEKQNIDAPKGVVLLGRPGTGKSLAAKAMGKMLGDLPVIVMDVGSLFGSLVGESEARVREALKIIDGINGCVLLIDEADKAFAGNNSGTSGDSGTSQRVLGSVLNWLNDHKSKTFVVLTLNRIDTLPPELLRAGRFDKMFYTDLPRPYERLQILDIHLRKRLEPLGKMIELTDEEKDTLTEELRNFVGAEIEEIVKDARLAAFNRTGDATPTFEDILESCRSRTPMADSDTVSKEVMKQCMKIATPVSKPKSSVRKDD